MSPPRKLNRYLMAVRGRRQEQEPCEHSKTSQTDEEKQRDRQRNEREAKKEEQDAINYKRDKEQREARLLDFEIRRQQTTLDRSIPPAFRSRSIEREILYERKRFSTLESVEIKEHESPAPTQHIFNETGTLSSATAGPPATAAAATAAIIPILPLGVATLRDDSTESEQSVPCTQNQLDAYHRIM
ncbi:uncharacterized protein Dwil_GK16424 [Drosophila willistoni]|uniref:Uncharacterized protein n=1 Tax=Drosophila willistoni TaxID=7260 RepID=B4N245_DROWI|nr:uncharacterized protein Dwil_GK16424 [Drosophila willistoni]